MEERPILVIDALNSFSRHFAANPTMSENGEHAGGFVGFVKSIGSLCSQFFPKKVIIVWESGGNQKRRDISGGSYKSGRRPQALNRYYENDIPNTWENHNKQISLTVEALKCLPVQQVYVKDTEADDIIGYICKYKFADSKIIIVSSDRDLYQLIDDRVTQWSLNQKKIIDSSEVIKKFGCSPQNFCSVRAFVGDSSDEIDGVRGAGFKTICKRFPEVAGQDFISVQDLVLRAQEMTKTSNAQIYQTMTESIEDVKKNWRLMNLDISSMNGDQVKKIEHQLGTSEPSPNKMELLRILVREGLRSIDIDTTFLQIKACAQ
jgi:5'-3' exonuclease